MALNIDTIRQLAEAELKKRSMPILKKIGKGAVSFVSDIAKGIVKPVVQTVAAPVQAIVSAAQYAKDPLRQADQSFTLPWLGKIEPPKTVREQVGRSIETVAAGWVPGKAAGAVLKPTLKTALIQGAKSGAQLGAVYGGGESLQKPGTFSPGQFAGDVAFGAGTGAVGGAVLGGAGYGVGKGVTKLKKTVNEISPTAEAKQAGFVKLPELGKKKIPQVIQNIQDDIKAGIDVGPQKFAQLRNWEEKQIPKPTPSKTTPTTPITQTELSQLPESQVTPQGTSTTSLPPLQHPVEISPYKSKVNDSLGVADKSLLVKPKINLDRLGLPDEIKNAPVVQATVEKTRETGSKILGKRLTHKEFTDMAAETSTILSQSMTREQTLAYEAALYKARQAQATILEQVATTGRMTASDVDKILNPSTVLSHTARILESAKEIAIPEKAKTINNILKSLYKEVQDSELFKKAASEIDWNNPEQVTKLVRDFIKPKASDWLDLIRYNSMLSSPTTHLINSASNAQGTGIVAPLEKTITGGLDALRSALSGTPRQYAAGEGLAYAKGYYSNIAKASKTFLDVMRGKQLITHPDLRNIPLTTSKAGRVLERTLDWPMRLLEAEDMFFRTLTEGGLEKSLTYRAKQGIINTADDATKEAAYRLFRGEMNQEGEGYVLHFIGGLGRVMEAFRHDESPIVSTIAKFTVPFIRTPLNLLKQGIEYSPLGITTLVGNTNKIQQLSKVIIGSSVAAGVATLMGQDRLTWGEPTNAKQKAAFRAAGRQPYSIKIGNKWISYSKLHPAMAFNFAIIAAIDDAQKQRHLDDTQADTILSGLAKYGNFFADQSYLKNIGDFVAGNSGDIEGYTRLAGNYFQQVIPFRALMSYVERLTDPKQRMADPNGTQLEKQIQLLLAQMPGFAQTVPARTGPLGQPIENQNRLLNAFSPNRITTVNPLYEGLFKINQTNSNINRMKTDIKDIANKELQKRMLIR